MPANCHTTITAEETPNPFLFFDFLFSYRRWSFFELCSAGKGKRPFRLLYHFVLSLFFITAFRFLGSQLQLIISSNDDGAQAWKRRRGVVGDLGLCPVHRFDGTSGRFYDDDHVIFLLIFFLSRTSSKRALPLHIHSRTGRSFPR
jgi:hypothetical protein